MNKAEIIKWLSPKVYAWGLCNLSKTQQRKFGLIPNPWARSDSPESRKA